MNEVNVSAPKGAVLATVIVPFAGLVAAIILSWGKGIDLVSFGLFAALSAMRILGITVGFHRLLTHKSFKTVPWVKVVLTVMGSMAIEGKPFVWVADHRRHHVHSDTEEDPHSPNAGRSGFLGALKGFVHSHIGWMLSDSRSDHARYIPDLMRDRHVSFVNRHFALWSALGLIFPAALGFLIEGTWTGALLGFLWGGLASVFFVHHTTWSINSVCHIFGSRPFRSKDQSRNNAFFGYLAFGEGWHHNHHAFERSAKHGLFWWQPDVSYLLIRLLEALGLAWDVVVPSQEEVKAKLSSGRSG
ncbi:MAG: acyl-CoA desaturase [Candidatus Taylorbacteria bacterium]|nr:acyl-CoA desaturase [Candidatus Taylorbacteria bacterium]